MNTNEGGKIMKITEMPGYQNLVMKLEVHDIVINDKYFALGRRMLPVVGSYVTAYENYMYIHVLLAVGEKAVIWDGLYISTDTDLKAVQSMWFSAWTGKYFDDVKKCFTLRANGISVGMDDSIDPWFPVLKDTERIISLPSEMDLVQYINALFAEADVLFNSIQVEGE